MFPKTRHCCSSKHDVIALRLLISSDVFHGLLLSSELAGQAAELHPQKQHHGAEAQH